MLGKVSTRKENNGRHTCECTLMLFLSPTHTQIYRHVIRHRALVRPLVGLLYTLQSSGQIIGMSVKGRICYIQQILFTFAELQTVTLRFPWDWDFPFFSICPQNKQAPQPDVAMLFLFLNWLCYWSWPTVTKPIPFSRPCGQHSAVIWSDPEVYSEPWMDLCVVLIGFGPLHHQLGFKATPFPCPTLLSVSCFW